MQVSIDIARPGRAEFHISGIDPSHGLPDTLWFETQPALDLHEPSLGSVAAVGLVQLAMHLGTDLAIDGPLCPVLMESLCDYQDAWVSWLPDFFVRQATVTGTGDPTGTGGREPDRSVRTAVLASSGGLDSSAALVLHATDALGPRRRRVTHAVMLHGMDIPLDQPDVFERAADRTGTQVKAMGAEPVTVRTNWRAFCPDWEMGFAAGVIAGLSLVAPAVGAGTAIMADDMDYPTQRYPWGSNFITNRMLGTAALEVTGCGGDLTRVDKAAVVAHAPAVANDLRVCWQGPDLSSNCGECPKCILTKLNFLAATGSVPPCLSPLRADQVAALRIPNSGSLLLLNQLRPLLEQLPADIAAAFAEMWDRENRAFVEEGHLLKAVAPVEVTTAGYRAALEDARRNEARLEADLAAVLGSRRIRLMTRVLSPLDRLRRR